jgi:choline transport protein
MCNSVAVVFVGMTTVFFCFPTSVPVNTDTMNYVSAVIGIFLVLLGVYWAVYWKRFEGPVCICFVPCSPLGFRNALIIWLQKFDVIMGIANEERAVSLFLIIDETGKGVEI